MFMLTEQQELKIVNVQHLVDEIWRIKEKHVVIDQKNCKKNKFSVYLKCPAPKCKKSYSFRGVITSELRENLKGPVIISIAEKNVPCLCEGETF